MMRLGSVFLAALLTSSIAASAGAKPFVPADNRLIFDITRNGEPIGKQELTFAREGTRLVVRNVVRIAVRVLFVTVYRYESVERSVWLDGRMESHTTRIDDDGDKIDLTITDAPGGLLLDGPEGQVLLPRGLKVDAFWNRDLVYDNATIDSTKGTISLYSVDPRIRETIEVGGQRIAAWRYAFHGDVNIEAWYDDDGRMLRIRQIVRDGSEVITELRP